MKYRAVSLCLIKREEQYLFVENYDEVIEVTYYRPVGGTIEFGEDSRRTVIREVKEEINADISEPELITVIENIYNYGADTGHDLNFIYKADIVDGSYYEQDVINGVEGEEGFQAVWIDLNSIINDANKKLVPDGLMQILTGEQDSKISKVLHYRSR